MRARASVTTLSDPVLGDVRLVTPTPRLSDTPGQHEHTGPPLGAHNEAVLGDWLGLDPAEVVALARDSVI